MLQPPDQIKYQGNAAKNKGEPGRDPNEQRIRSKRRKSKSKSMRKKIFHKKPPKECGDRPAAAVGDPH